MTIKELKEKIKDLPDDMRFGLLDSTTDDFGDSNYSVTGESFEILDYVEEEEREIVGKALFLVFENVLNENPI